MDPKWQIKTNEPVHGKTNKLHMPKQRRRSAVQDCTVDQRLCIRYMDSTIPLQLLCKASSFLL